MVVCEGSDETNFLKGLIRGRGLDPDSFDPIEAGGKNAIPHLLSTLRLDPPSGGRSLASPSIETPTVTPSPPSRASAMP